MPIKKHKNCHPVFWDMTINSSRQNTFATEPITSIVMNKGWRALSTRHSPRASLLNFFLLVAFPAFLMACTATESADLSGDYYYDGDRHPDRSADSVHTEVRLVAASPRITTKAESWWLIKRVDVFVFNDGEIQSLDSYKREYAYSTSEITAASSSGDKIIVAIANSHLENDDINGIHVYEDLDRLKTRLTEDTPEYPLMTGEARFCAGDGKGCSIVLYPMMSEIHIASLKCKMEGAYAGKRLEKVKAYLTNVNGRTDMMRWDGFRPTELLNTGRMIESDMQQFAFQRMVYSYIGNGKTSADIQEYGSSSLFCYPNDTKEESAGSPYTTLVIEGQIDGKTNYYPIRINREGYGYKTGVEGIIRNAKYVMNLTITGPGADDPEGEIPSMKTVTQGTMAVHPANFITAHDGERLHVWVDVYPEETEVWIDEDDLDFDRERGIYDYEIDEDGKGVWLTLLKGGSGAFIINAGEPVNDGLLVIIVVNP